MLSTQAWNAFLKTLEEPPPNTIFVLATTEANKVLPTVVDRCHRFDFARPTVEQIASVLRARGRRRVDRDRARRRRADRAPRDRLVPRRARHARAARRPTRGTDDRARRRAGRARRRRRRPAVRGRRRGRRRRRPRARCSRPRGWPSPAATSAVLRATSRPTRASCSSCRRSARCRAELRLTPEHDERLAEQAARVPGRALVRLLDLLADALRAMKDGADARTQLELALVKAAAPEVDPSPRALLARIERLEAALGERAPAPATRGAAARRAAAAARREPPRAAEPPGHAPRRPRRHPPAPAPPIHGARARRRPPAARPPARHRDRPADEPTSTRSRSSGPPSSTRPRRQRAARRLPRRGPARRGRAASELVVAFAEHDALQAQEAEGRDTAPRSTTRCAP